MSLHCTILSKYSEAAAIQSLPSKSADVPFSAAHADRRKISKYRLQQHSDHDNIQMKRKESVLSPKRKRQCSRTSFLGSFSASLTVEAAIELPLFFVLIAIVLQYAAVCRTAAQFSGLMTTTAQEMAIAAYKEEYGDANHLIRGVLSDAWATSQVMGKAEDADAVRGASFLNSSYLKDGDMIRLVLSYQPRPRYALLPLPFCQGPYSRTSC